MNPFLTQLREAIDERDAEEQRWLETLSAAGQREWQEYRRQALVSTAVEELGHALVARHDYWPIVLITTVRAPGRYLGATLLGDPPKEFDAIAGFASWSTHAQAGDIASRLFEMTPELLALAAIEIDEAAVTAAAIARLSPEDAEDARAYVTRKADEENDEQKRNDEEKVEEVAVLVAGDAVADRYSSVWRARAWRHVFALYPLLLALLPSLLRDRVWTGDDLEAAIAATGKET